MLSLNQIQGKLIAYLNSHAQLNTVDTSGDNYKFAANRSLVFPACNIQWLESNVSGKFWLHTFGIILLDKTNPNTNGIDDEIDSDMLLIADDFLAWLDLQDGFTYTRVSQIIQLTDEYGDRLSGIKFRIVLSTMRRQNDCATPKKIIPPPPVTIYYDYTSGYAGNSFDITSNDISKVAIHNTGSDFIEPTGTFIANVGDIINVSINSGVGISALTFSKDGVEFSTGTSFTVTAGTSYLISGISTNPSISGTPIVCVSLNTNLTYSGDSGGIWSSDNTGVATVNSATGVVTGIAAGSATITYTIGVIYATLLVTVQTSPYAGYLTTVDNVIGTIAVGGTIDLTVVGGDLGGSWYSNSHVTVVSIDAITGRVTGVTPGNAVIAYSVTNSCGTSEAGIVITVTS